jgi:hypothetical protein
MSEETLPLRFEKSGWHFSQVARAGDVALYRRSKLYDGTEGAVHYEVIRIAHQREGLGKHGIVYAAKELYPPSASWGKRGWTFKTLPDAQATYATLVEVSHV